MFRYITMIEKTFQGAHLIYGRIGTRQYMGYTKQEAIKLYNREARANVRAVKDDKQ